MKLQIASDTHVAYKQDFDIKEADSDVIILAGDIAIKTRGLDIAEKIADKHQKPVLYVAGNHEYYMTDLPQHLSEMREKAAAAENVHFLENDVFEFAGVRFLGTTLWTSYALDGRFDQRGCMQVAGLALNDHRCIEFEDRMFLPKDALEMHDRARQFLKTELDKPFSGKTVVITHHAPSLKCEHPKFGVDPVAAAFMSQCDHLMENVDVWVFGHTHANKDFYINDCHVISNQVGYAGENLESPYRPDLLVEV